MHAGVREAFQRAVKLEVKLFLMNGAPDSVT